MKPFKEEKTGLRTGINKLYILFVILYAINAECQIPINGFCKLNSFSVDSGYSGLLSLNYNNDTYTDLVIYSPLKNKLLVMEGAQLGAFLPLKEMSINFQPSVIQNIYDLDKKVTGYAYVSRKKRKAGIIEFTPQGLPKHKREIKLSSYPDNISTSDVDQDGSSEFLLSGSAFDGLSLVSQVNGKLTEKKITKGAVYSYSFFSDISNDDFSDIVSYNLLSMGIDIFYNNGGGHFTKERTLSVNRKIKSMKIADVNLDSYADIIYSYDNIIAINTGQFNSSFTLSSSIRVKYSPDIFITADFNKDGKIDIAYTDTTMGILSIIFSSGTDSYYDEVVYCKKEHIRDIIPFYSKFVNGLVLLSKSGQICTVTNLTSLNDESKIVPSVFASAPAYCKSNEDAINDLCFIDQFDSSIKLFVNSSSGVPKTLYSFPLYQNENELLVSDDGKTFVSFKKGERLVEVIKPNLSSGKVERHAFYFDGKLTDVRITGNPKAQTIYSAGFSDDKLLLKICDFNSKALSVSQLTAGNGIIDAKIVPGKLPLIYFWQSKGDSLILYHSSFNGNDLDKPVTVFALKMKYYDNILLFTGGTREGNSVVISVINSGRHRHVIVSGEKYSFMNSDNEITGRFNITSEKQLYYGEAYFRGFGKVMFYSPSEKSVNWIEILKRDRKVYFNKLVADVYASEYFIKNMNLRNYNMVYINNEHCLNIRQIK